eukprot:98369-Amphidinium_carterae.1
MSSSRRGDASRRESRMESRNPPPQETLPGRGNAPPAPTFSGNVTEWKAYELKARMRNLVFDSSPLCLEQHWHHSSLRISTVSWQLMALSVSCSDCDKSLANPLSLSWALP